MFWEKSHEAAQPESVGPSSFIEYARLSDDCVRMCLGSKMRSMRFPDDWFASFSAPMRRAALGLILAIGWIAATEAVDRVAHFTVWYNWFQILTVAPVVVWGARLVGGE